MAELPNGLLDAVRNYLDITWTDAVLDTKLTGIIARGMADIDKVAGHALDYTIEDNPRALLMDYCRYARAGALEQFHANYQSELLNLQHEYEVKYYATLASLFIGDTTLEPGFNSLIKAYGAETENNSAIIMAAAYQDSAMIVIKNGTDEVANGTAAYWVSGENVVTVAVTLGTITRTYTVTVTKG